MLTQGPAPDPRYKLNIISFLTLLHSLHCLICTKDIMNMLLQVMGGWEVWVFFFIYVRVWVGDRGWVSYFFSIFCSVFVQLLIVLSWLVMIVCCVCFIARFLLSLSLVPLFRHY